MNGSTPTRPGLPRSPGLRALAALGVTAITTSAISWSLDLRLAAWGIAILIGTLVLGTSFEARSALLAVPVGILAYGQPTAGLLGLGLVALVRSKGSPGAGVAPQIIATSRLPRPDQGLTGPGWLLTSADLLAGFAVLNAPLAYEILRHAYPVDVRGPAPPGTETLVAIPIALIAALGMTAAPDATRRRVIALGAGFYGLVALSIDTSGGSGPSRTEYWPVATVALLGCLSSAREDARARRRRFA